MAKPAGDDRLESNLSVSSQDYTIYTRSCTPYNLAIPFLLIFFSHLAQAMALQCFLDKTLFSVHVRLLEDHSSFFSYLNCSEIFIYMAHASFDSPQYRS